MKCRTPAVLLLVSLLVTGCAMAPVAAPTLPSSPTEGPAPAEQPATPPPEPAAPPPEPAAPPEPAVSWVVRGHWGPVYTENPSAGETKAAVLTFDDGPSEEYTGHVLDTLKEHGAKAIFFVNGHAARHPDLIRRIVAEGHTLGNHTMTHENLDTLSPAQQRSQIDGVNQIIKEITGQQPYWFRAPFGAFDDDTLAILSDLHMQLLNWSHGSGDWMEVEDGYKDPAIVIHDVLSETPRNSNMTPLHPGAVILFHDTLRHTAESLPEIIKGLKEMGYTFVIPEPSRS
ncbi:MAG TPA: polysaccharide deacetylase family protein [Symbiobacteriaceae bacterium]|nr:polysaccharide deacetylase family protein [Symbiobacteriaceae bacterium]